jgi:tripartite-type tricarboxylate transporter receptor subunit TctC
VLLNGGAGSGADTVTRIMAARLARDLDQSVVVENQPAGAGVVGYLAAVRARKDGLTLLSAISRLLLGPLIDPSLPFDVFNGVIPVSQIQISAGALCVSPGLGVKDLAGFLARGRAAGPPLAIGYFGHGTSSHIQAELLVRRAGLRAETVPYPGTPALMQDLLAGHIKAGMVELGSVIGLLRAGELLGLALTGPRRLAPMPGMPLFAEHGLTGFEPQLWHGTFLPPETPAQIVAAWGAAVSAAMRSEEVSGKLRDLGTESVGSLPDAFTAMLRREREVWAPLVAEIGIR